MIDAALVEVAAFCRRRVPPRLREQMRLEHSVRGNRITIDELRAPWHPDLSQEWTRLKIAQLRLSEAGWSLYWRDSSERWRRYEGNGEAPTVTPLLEIVDDDLDGVFWG